MSRDAYQVGDLVIYRKTKHGLRPGPRAHDVSPAEAGDEYTYLVDKFWIVVVANAGMLTLRTRRGKQHVVSAADPNLRPAHWWERLLNRGRFPSLTTDAGQEIKPKAEAESARPPK